MSRRLGDTVGKEDQTYRRARTQEQKNQRLDDILDTTESILDEGSYHDVTLSAIAEKVGCSRANLSHYVRSKEEILLLLYIRSLKGILEDMRGIDPGALDVSSMGNLKNAAAILATVLSSQRDFGRLGALLPSIIETNVSLERLIQCKHEITTLMTEGSDLSESRLWPLPRHPSAPHPTRRLQGDGLPDPVLRGVVVRFPDRPARRL